ncbi:hypothetical protein [Glutamicibacter nicotianae]|uniref:hypothetical protein n=1 Tax=Glutamicibacter nicotianae TaxID=37929 RepID=UPI002552B455|nr:hypothetical protein [Glutamicibacter nicotianae]WIV42594.1 hypothetical protein QQS42_09640 [Glutamicibacter nicotianae]
MAESSKRPVETIEQRVEALEAELAERRKSELIKDSMIIEYRQALSNAQYALAIANGQLKLATQPTE